MEDGNRSGSGSGARYRREDVARAAGVKVRNLRYYQERGLLPPPRREGRIAWYSDDHLTRLRLINDLLGRGYTVNGIGELLQAWEEGGGLSQLLGLEREMTRDWVQDEPVTLTRSELRELFGPTATAADTRRAAELGYVTVEGDLVTYPSRRLLEATLALVRQGVPLAEILDAGEFVQTQAAALADRFVGLFRRHVIGLEGLERLSAAQLQHITAAVRASAGGRRGRDHGVRPRDGPARGRRGGGTAPYGPVGVGSKATLAQPCQPPLALLHSTRR